MRMMLSLLSGQEEPLEIDDIDKGKATHNQVTQAATAISAEWNVRYLARNGSNRPDESLGVWMRRTCYEFITELNRLGLVHHLITRMHKASRYSDSENLFQRCLLAIFVEIEPDKMTSNDRKVNGRKLWYAYRHYVPVEFLEGFISQISFFDSKTDYNTIEPRFEMWIAKNRSIDTATLSDRGSYPPYVMRLEREYTTAVVSYFSSITGDYVNDEADEADETDGTDETDENNTS